MRKTFLSLTCAAVAALSFSFAEDASAACTRLGFSVNDYGKEGPARDAKQLLDKYIAKWAGENGIAKYTTGKKDVTCELFLDFIVFDEYTCRAEASVCWEGAPVKSAAQSSELDANAAPAAKPKPAKAAAAKTPSHVETGSVDKAPAPEAGQEAGQEAGGDAGAGEGNDQATP